MCQATCQATCQSTPVFICTSLAPTTAIQIKKLDYCHHPQIDFCCLGFLDISDRILIWSSLITRDICRVSLVVLLLRSITRLFFTHTLTHIIQNAFLILWQILSNSFVLHDQQHCSGKLYVIYYPPGRDWGDPQQQFLCQYCIVRGAVLVQFRTAL